MLITTVPLASQVPSHPNLLSICIAGIGYVAAILTMVAAAVVEIIRLQVVADNNLQDTDPTVVTVPMSVWWQIPQYFLLGMSEAFAMVGVTNKTIPLSQHMLGLNE